MLAVSSLVQNVSTEHILHTVIQIRRRPNDYTALSEKRIPQTPVRLVGGSDSQQATASWEAPWTSAMSEETFQKLADPWEAWDLQWLEQFINIGE